MFGVIKRNPTVSIIDLCRLLLPQQKRLEEKNCSYTGYSRFALYNILKLLKFESGSKILLPAYNCDVVITPFRELGIVPLYYGVTDKFQIDFDTISFQADIKAIITVNYFGLSQEFDAIQAFVEQHSLIWLNDNSHGFASCHGDRRLESYGDFSITSFRKVLPCINGSKACINNDNYKSLQCALSESNDVDRIERKIFRFIVTTVFAYCKFRPIKLPDYSQLLVEADEKLMDYNFDRLSSKLLRMVSEETVQEKRYQIYQAINLFLVDKNYDFLKVIPSILKQGNSPMLYPLEVSDQRYWRCILQISRDVGFDIHTWPTMPQEVIEKNIHGCVSRWQKLIFLPLHQDLQEENYCTSLTKVFDRVKIECE